MRSLEAVASSPESVCPLLNGMKVPEISVRRSDGSALDLAGAVKERPTILVFYRGGW